MMDTENISANRKECEYRVNGVVPGNVAVIIIRYTGRGSEVVCSSPQI